MFGKPSADCHLLILSKGEEIVQSILDYCQDNSIDSAWISGLGALSQIDLALYRLEDKEYFRKSLSGDYELLNLNGNVGKLEGKTMAHLHASISDDQMAAFGGHLDRAIVAATCEIMIQVIDNKIHRKHSEEIGLNLIGRE